MPYSNLIPPADTLSLGKQVSFPKEYNPHLLEVIPRQASRESIGISNAVLPFYGFDLWTLYEVSWLNPQGMPQLAIAELLIPASTTHLIESKSLKLYLNSLNQHVFIHWDAAQKQVKTDLATCLNASIEVHFYSLDTYQAKGFAHLEGILLDTLPLQKPVYEYQPSLLQKSATVQIVNEQLYSHLLKSNCLITEQPDWASLFIHYQGQQICHQSLLSYIISFRNHNEFHEQCIERIFQDIMTHLRPEKLTVQARYTRRGGIDINPSRSTEKEFTRIHRTVRQ